MGFNGGACGTSGDYSTSGQFCTYYTYSFFSYAKISALSEYFLLLCGDGDLRFYDLHPEQMQAITILPNTINPITLPVIIPA